MAKYEKKNWKKYLMWYIVIGILAYALIYFVFFRPGY